MTVWTFDSFDFVVLCNRFGRDRLPYPLTVAIDVATEGDLRQQREEASARIDAAMGENLDMAMRTVADPIVRVECLGESADPTRPTVRTHAALRHDVAAVLTQRPGSVASPGGAVTIELTKPSRACALVVDSVPHCTAGSLPVRRLARERTPSASGGVRLSTATREATAGEQFRQFFDRPRTTAGEIIVARGATYDNRRDVDAIAFFWMDYERDGRYIVHSGDSIDIVPADSHGLASEISGHVAAALRR